MRSAVLLAVIGLSGCASTYSITNLRTPYPGPEKLEISCATYPGTDEADLNRKMTSLYAAGWRLASSGSYGIDIFLCFERPADGHAHAERHPARHESAPAAPTEPEEKAAPSGGQSDSSSASAPAESPAPSDSSSASTAPPDNSSSETPRRHRPISGE